MKEKIKKFLSEKRDLLLFVGILSVVFAGVLTIANLAINEDVTVDYSDNNDSSDNTTDDTTDDDTSDADDTTWSNFITPISEEYEIVRTFFGDYSSEELVDAIIITGETMETSKGVSYASTTNDTFDVLAIYPGRVIDITQDEIKGNIVTLDHGNNIVSIYSSLQSVSVTENQELKIGEKIGVAGSNLYDNEAGVHVHLEVLVFDEYVDPRVIIGKTADDIFNEK